MKGRDGRLYFGGIANGFNIIDPAGVPIDTVPPPVLITQCTIFNDPVPITQSGTLDLAHDQNYISLNSLPWTLPLPNGISTATRWKDLTGAGQKADGADLHPTQNALGKENSFCQISGSNGDGTWSRQDASLTIRIASPYWERAWFRGGILALAVAALSLAYRANIRRLQKEQRLQSEFSRKLNESQETVRKRIAGELHDGLGQELLAIKSSIDHLAGEAPSPGNLKDVSDAVQQAIEDVREISADLHAHMLERLGLTRTVKATIRRVSEATGLDISATVDSLDNLFTPFEEINIYRILQEAFNNIVRHSHASQCRVRVTVANGNMVMEVTDDGCGFEAENARTSSDGGLGLVNMAERVRILDGDMDIESAPGKGTSLRFRIPLKGGSGCKRLMFAGRPDSGVFPDDKKDPHCGRRSPTLSPGGDDCDSQAEEFEVVGEADNGEQALDMLDRLRPDLALVDISMPVMDGLRLVRTARARGSTCAFVILTMFKDDEYFVEAMDLGVMGYLLKDGATDEVLACLRTVARGKHYVSPAMTDLLVLRSKGPGRGCRRITELPHADGTPHPADDC